MGFPTLSADSMYTASRHATSILVDAIKDASPFEPSLHEDLVLVASRHYQKQLDAENRDLFTAVCSELDPSRQQALKRS